MSLIKNGRLHDISKFNEFEFEFVELNKGGSIEGFSKALQFHRESNYHHPEKWNGIKNMPSLYVAEMVCDWLARANEFGTDISQWIRNEATKRFDFKMSDPVGIEIQGYLDMLLVPPFS
jgi:hypothetical protein